MYVWIYETVFLVYLFICQQTLGSFHLVGAVNTAVNMGIQIFLRDHAFNAFGYISRKQNCGII